MQSSQIALLKSKALKLKTSSASTDIYHDGKDFSVVEGNKLHQVKPVWLDSELRNATMPQLLALQKNGYITVNRMANGDITLRSHLKLRGGGWLLGPLCYIGMNGLLWGGVGLATMVGMRQILKETATGNIPADAISEGAGHMANAGIRAGMGCVGDCNLAAGFTTAALNKAFIASASNPEMASFNAAATAIGMSTPHMAMAGGLAAWIEGMSLAAYEFGLSLPWL